MPRKYWILLAGIVCIGTLLRIVSLTSNPAGFFTDEAVIGLDALSFITYGTDHLGNPPSFLIEALGDYRGFVQILTAMPLVHFFGLSETTVRLTSALYGIATIGIVFLLTRTLFNSSTALVAALFLSLSPWHVHISRIGWQNATLAFWFTTSIYMFILSLKRPILFYLSAAGFGITMYTYFPGRLLSPLMLSALLLLYRKELRHIHTTRTFWTGLGYFAVFLIPLIIGLVNGQTMARLQLMSVFQQDLSWIEKLFHITASYMNYFSPMFLFTHGDIHFPGQFITRHSVGGLGELYFMQFPLIVYGIYYIWKKRTQPPYLLILIWLLIYPLSGAFTDIQPQATRGIIGSVMFQIISAIGLVEIYRWIEKRFARFQKWFYVGTNRTYPSFSSSFPHTLSKIPTVFL